MNGTQLRNSILQFAIQGKLVPQDSNDEPASVLLEHIREEKQKLVKAKTIKADKNESIIYRGEDGSWYEKVGNSEPKCIDEQLLFNVPKHWHWVRVGQIFNVRSAMRIHQTDWQKHGIPFFRGRELVQLAKTGHVDFEIYLSRELYEKNKEKGGVPQKDDILISAVGTIGKTYIVKGDKEFYYKDAYILCLENIGKIYPNYMELALNTPYLQKQIHEDAQATTVAQLTIERCKELLIPLPPLAEQKRIVAKLEEILPLVESYDKAQQKLDELNKALPDRLRKSILQEAIQGKLVEQDPSDEPASVLLERIREEKQKLVKAKVIKADKNESTIYRGEDGSWYEKAGKTIKIIDGELPFDIPQGWLWTRFGNVMYNRDSQRIPLSVSQRQSLEKKYDYYGASGVIDKVDKYLFDKPLLLIGEDGANLLNRNTPIAFIAKGKYWVNNHAHVLDCINLDFMHYVCIYINAISLANYVTGTAQPKMNQEKMNSIFIPIPPLTEQKRIVAKLGELLKHIKKA